jgi:hypothetical protein
VIILDPGTGAAAVELEDPGAARLLAVLDAAGDGSGWLAGALRQLGHANGWTGTQPGAPGSPG